MATIYTYQSRNEVRTYLLMGVFLAIVVALGYFISYYYQSPILLYIAIVFAVLMNIASYWYSDKITLALSKARPADPQSPKELDLIRTVENLAITAGLPAPRVYVVDDPAPNAFATGRNAKHAAVAATSGLLDIMNKTELEGVMAHEMSHVGNRDILLSSVVVVLVGFISILADIFIRMSFFGGIGGRGNNDRNNGGGLGAIFMVIGVIFIILSPIFAQLIQFAISRRRESLADADGALLTRYPEGLASALEKIEKYGKPMVHASNATAHLFIADPFGSDAENAQGVAAQHTLKARIAGLFMTHPPVEERIAALRAME